MDQGIKFGRKPHKGTDKALELIAAGATAKEVMEATGISKATYYRLKSQSSAA